MTSITSPPRRSQAGIAIVSVLMVLVALTLFGLSSLFLTQMNLGIATNARSTTMADNNAATGLNAAFVALQAHYEANGELPTSLTLPTVSGRSYAPTFSLSNYVRYSTSTAYVAVLGSAPGQGEYLTEALVQVESNSSLPSYFNYGIATEGTFTASGNAAYVSAGIHANKGYTFSGNQSFKVCTHRAANGTCSTEVSVSGANIAISASPGATTCSVSGNPASLKNDICAGSPLRPRYLTDPVVITPDFNQRLTDVLAEVSHGPSWSHTLGIDCDVKYSSSPGSAALLAAFSAAPAGTTVCVESGAVSFSGNYSFRNINLVTSGNISFSGNWDANDITLVSTNGTISSSGNHPLENARVFAKKGVTFSGNADLSGQTTIASGEGITISGNAQAITGAAGGLAIGIALIAEKNITVSGNTKWFVAAVAGGTFTKSGNAELLGRIAAKGNITISGNFDIDAGVPIENTDLGDEEQPVLHALSRR